MKRFQRYFLITATICAVVIFTAHVFGMEGTAGRYLYLGENPSISVDLLVPAPADGDTVDVDAPGFNWLPEDSSRAFILEISRNQDFPESPELLKKVKESGTLIPLSPASAPLIARSKFSSLVAGLPLSLYHPSFKLGAGHWFWRWRCVFSENRVSPPSAARRFVVSENALSYTVPPLEELFSRIPGRHPRLFIRPEYLDSLRRLPEISGPHRKLYKRIEACADSLCSLPIMEEPLPFPDGKGAYVDKTIDKFLIYHEYFDQARQMGQVLDFLGFCYLMTSEPKWSSRAKEWLMSLTKWDINGPSSMKINDEVAMPIFLNGARAYDWIYDTLSDHERVAIRKMLIARGQQIFETVQQLPFHVKPYASHEVRVINYLSQASCVLWGESKEAEKWLSYIIPVVTTFYPPWGGRDGGYAEGPSYWRMYFNYMLQSALCLETATGLDILKTPFYRNDGYYKIYGDPYFSRQQPFADTGEGTYWPADKINLYRLAAVFKNPYFRWRAEMSEPEELPVAETVIPTGVMSFFWLDEGEGHVKPEPPSDLPRSYVFRDIGLVAFHEDPTDPRETYLLFKSTPFGSWSHIYADQNAFYIQAFGEALAIQSGYYPFYRSPHHSQWTWHTKAHNTVLVDGAGQKIRDRASRGKIIAFSAGNGEPGSLDYAAGDATEAYEGRLNKFVRHVYYQRPHHFLIVDELEAPKPARFDWLLHSYNKMEIDQQARTVTIVQNKARLSVEFVSPTDITLSQTGRFTVPAEFGLPDQWHLTVSTNEALHSAIIIVKMKVWEETK
ncbi:MAG TPA: DUF4962 domain-containing protein [archaeon]|nr:DUF4962 domain-containing protein [archaeon]